MDKNMGRSWVRTRLLSWHDDGGKRILLIVTLGILITHYAVFLIFPILYGLYGSFFTWNLIAGSFDFIGLEHYTSALTDKLFWIAMLNNLYFAAVTVILVTCISLLTALGIHSVRRFKGFFRTVYFMPVITSMVATALIWKWMYEPKIGLFNQMLYWFDLPAMKWLSDPILALPSIIIMTVWKNVGFAIVIYLVGLLNIPKSLYEAGRIDGAGRRQAFWHITIPMLRPTTLFVLITSIIDYLQVFVPIFIMTKGGPGQMTYTTSFLIYDTAFQYYNLGKASAISFLLFLVIIAVSFLQMKIMQRKGGYEL